MFLALFENATTERREPTAALPHEHRELVSRLCRAFEYGNFVSIIDDARDVIKCKREAITDSFYDDYIRIVFGVEEAADDRRARSLIGEGIVSLAEADERDFDVRGSVLESIVSLLERYDFSADGGPTDIDPSVLGNVFEKTINHLTTDPGDRNADFSAYYTPSEITRFSAEETVPRSPNGSSGC